MNNKEMELLKSCKGIHKTEKELFECKSCCLMFELPKIKNKTMDITMSQRDRHELITSAYKRGFYAGTIATGLLAVAVIIVLIITLTK
jgi:hypothetical protein